MKVLVEVDDALMAKVIEITHSKTAEEAVSAALEDMSMRDWLKDVFTGGMGLTREEIMNGVDPDYDIQAIRDATIWPRPKTIPSHETAMALG